MQIWLGRGEVGVGLGLGLGWRGGWRKGGQVGQFCLRWRRRVQDVGVTGTWPFHCMEAFSKVKIWWYQ